MNSCSDCGSRNLQFANYEVICANCGLILEDAPVEREKEIQVHPHLTTAGSKGVDGRLVKQAWLFTTREKNILAMERKMEGIANRLHMPSLVTKEAKVLFRTVVDKQLTVGRDNISFAYACVYMACHMHGLSKIPLEVVAHSPVTVTKMMRACRIIQRNLGVKREVSNPMDMLPRFGSRIGLSDKAISYATDLVMKLHGSSAIAGKKPSTIVASVLYAAAKHCGENVTQREVANATGVLEVTIRKNFKNFSTLSI